MQTSSGISGLMDVCNNGHEDTVDTLLLHPDIDVNLKDHHGRNALYLAERRDYYEIVEKVKNYKRGIDRREGVISKTPKKLDIEKLTAYK